MPWWRNSLSRKEKPEQPIKYRIEGETVIIGEDFDTGIYSCGLRSGGLLLKASAKKTINGRFYLVISKPEPDSATRQALFAVSKYCYEFELDWLSSSYLRYNKKKLSELGFKYPAQLEEIIKGYAEKGMDYHASRWSIQV